MEPTEPSVSSTNGISCRRVFRGGCALLLALFIGKTLWLAHRVPPGVPPDEMFHLQVIDIYAGSPFLFPFSESWTSWDQPRGEYVRFGRTVKYPPLYHLLLGSVVRLAGLETFDFKTVFALRVLNIAMVVGGLWFFLRTCLLLVSPPVTLLALAAHTNVLMHTFISSAVIYDNLANAAVAAAFYYFMRSLKKADDQSAVQMLTALGAGVLAKASVLPLAIILALSWAIVRGGTGESARALKNGVVLSGPLSRLLFVVVSALTVEFYLGNIVRYGHPLPTCAILYGTTACYARSYYEQIQLASAEPTVSLLAYCWIWIDAMVRRSVGIHSFDTLVPSDSYITAVEALLAFVFTVFLVRWGRWSRLVRCLALNAVAYLVFLALYWNYLPYLDTGNLGAGINGRYAFPVLGVLCLMFAASLLSLFSGARAWVVAVLFSGMFVLFELPFAVGADEFKDFLRPRKESFYRQLPYFPNPIYDEQFRPLPPAPEVVE